MRRSPQTIECIRPDAVYHLWMAVADRSTENPAEQVETLSPAAVNHIDPLPLHERQWVIIEQCHTRDHVLLASGCYRSGIDLQREPGR